MMDEQFEILKVKGSCAMLPENIRFRSFIKAVDKSWSVVVCRKKGT